MNMLQEALKVTPEKKANSGKTCVPIHTWINDMLIMKIKTDTIPWRITTYFQRDVTSRRTTNTYSYHKRKWHEKQEQNKHLLFLLMSTYSDPFSVFWFNSPHHYVGSMFRCFVDSLYFWEIIGNNHLTSATKHRKFKRLMRGMKKLVCFCFVTFPVLFSRSGWKKIALKRFASKYILAQSNCPLFIVYRALSVLYVFFFFFF